MRRLLSPAASSNVALRMERVTFDNVAGNARNWSLWAGKIEVLRTPGAYIQSTLQRADVTDLRDGKLYALPEGLSAGREIKNGPASSSTDRPAALFSARQGRYALGTIDPLPGDLPLLYDVQWQFRLSGDVHFRTREGDQLTAPELTILEMVQRRTGRTERRILCGQGADMTVKNVTVHANSLRYDPASRTVECTGGVRCEPHAGDAVQTESAFWSIRDQTLRCPNSTSGVWNGTTFSAGNLTLDTRTNDVQGNGLELTVKRRDGIGIKTPF